MVKGTSTEAVLTAARARVKLLTETRRIGVEDLIFLADVEVRAEQAKQQELANMIAMASNPSACPFPQQDVLARIKELTNLG